MSKILKNTINPWIKDKRNVIFLTNFAFYYVKKQHDMDQKPQKKGRNHY